jgi:hypothetical protein
MHPPRVNSLLVVAALLCASGCGEKVDVKARFDREVDEAWRKNWSFVEADQFFTKGGLFMDTGERGEVALDRPHVQPLLKRLREKHGLNWEAVVDKKKPRSALAIVARLPHESHVEQIRTTIAAEQDRFPGEILHQYGHSYVTIDFLTQEELAWEREVEAKMAGKR